MNSAQLERNRTRTSLPLLKKYGISEEKKAEIDSLTLDVIDAQHDVQQFSAIVDSLTLKSNNFKGFLAVAEDSRTKAYNNKISIQQIVQSAKSLIGYSDVATNEMLKASGITNDLSVQIKNLVDKLIYSSEMMDNFSNIVLKKKLLNPFMSDELIDMISTVGKDANNAVALTLVALKSTFAAEAANLESQMALALEDKQSNMLNLMLVDVKPLLLESGEQKEKEVLSLRDYLYKAYKQAVSRYKQANKALKIITKQLDDSVALLNKAQVKLKSLQSGLAAANAAALAS